MKRMALLIPLVIIAVVTSIYLIIGAVQSG
jgi:hypothetical protein